MSFIARKVGRKYAAQHLAGAEPADPHYEQYVDPKGRQRKRKRAMPAGLSKRDERILRSVRRRAHYLDKGFSLCGFRFGWTAILGLIPGAGDIAQFLLGYSLVLRKCREAELPATLTQRMMFNQLVGLGIGLIPLVGDLALAVFKANSRNAALLEDFLIRRAANAPTPGAAVQEEDLAQLAMSEGRIDRRTGEKVGGARAAADAAAPPPGSAGTSGSATPAQIPPQPQPLPQPAGKKKDGNLPWYGWGGKKKGESVPAEVSGATAASTSGTHAGGTVLR
ncbi:hypothetical protein JCM3770_003933 [Rhodotorula araucariae]